MRVPDITIIKEDESGRWKPPEGMTFLQPGSGKSALLPNKKERWVEMRRGFYATWRQTIINQIEASGEVGAAAKVIVIRMMSKPRFFAIHGEKTREVYSER